MWQSMKVISIVAAGMLVAALVGCAKTETQHRRRSRALLPTPQHWFRVSWDGGAGPHGERRLHGYVERLPRRGRDQSPVACASARCLRNVIGQRLEWGPK